MKDAFVSLVILKTVLIREQGLYIYIYIYDHDSINKTLYQTRQSRLKCIADTNEH